MFNCIYVVGCSFAVVCFEFCLLVCVLLCLYCLWWVFLSLLFRLCLVVDVLFGWLVSVVFIWFMFALLHCLFWVGPWVWWFVSGLLLVGWVW